ncbi:MAG: allose kinase [Tenericutes bacterium]|nr:allose kinase [Mycoplasmatota bacterium]
MGKVLGIDVGGTFTRFGVVHNKFVSSVEKLFTANIDDFVAFVDEQVKKDKEIKTISIGIPGIVKDNKIVSIPNISNIDIDAVNTKLHELTRLDVVINRDVNLLFYNDLDRLNLKHEENVLGFYVGTGLGNAIKVNGVVLKGSHGFAGELGHIPLIGNKRLCNCGKTGCAETLVSGMALVNLHKENNLSGEIKNIFVNHLNHEVIKDFIHNLALIISMEINIFDTTKIVIGGGVANMPEFPKEKLRNLIKKELRSKSLIPELEIYFVDDLPINSIIGASLIVKEE